MLFASVQIGPITPDLTVTDWKTVVRSGEALGTAGIDLRLTQLVFSFVWQLIDRNTHEIRFGHGQEFDSFDGF